jgi:hypothetical protein
MPVRQYRPKEVETVNLTPIDREYKPGFYQQATAFRSLIEGEETPDYTAGMEDAIATLDLCERLLPDSLPATWAEY